MLKAMQQIGGKRLTLLVAFLVVCNTFAFLHTPTTYAHTSRPAYECGNDQTNHCYGQEDWFGPVNSHLGGVETRIVVQAVACNYPPGGQCQSNFLNNEIWMYDSTSSQAQYCTETTPHACWVEAGYQGGSDGCAFDLYNFQCYFWADERPHSTLYNHWNYLPSDNYGHHTRFKIKWLGNGSWDVLVQPLVYTDGYWDSTSTNNTIYPQDEVIGEELAGSAIAGTANLYTPTYADWDHNEWADANANFHYQTSCVNPNQGGNCAPTDGDPPFESWVSYPDCCNNGGDFQAYTPQGY